jgi:hypothetical protein
MPGTNFTFRFDVDAPPAPAPVVAGVSSFWGEFEGFVSLPESNDAQGGVRDGDTAVVDEGSGVIVTVKNDASADTWVAKEVSLGSMSDLTSPAIGGVPVIQDGAVARLSAGSTILTYQYQDEEWVTLDPVPRVWTADEGDFPDAEWPVRHGDVGFVFLDDAEGLVALRHADPTWDILFGVVSSTAGLAALEDYEKIPYGSFALVSGGSVFSFDDPWNLYGWDGDDWALISEPPAGPTTNVWALSTPYEIPVGAEEGDVGFYGSLGMVLRSLSLPGGGSEMIWLPKEVDNGTPVVRAYLRGTEATGSYAAQGLAAVTAGGGTITPNVAGSGMTRFDSSSGASRSAYAQVVTSGGWVSGSTRVYVVGKVRAASTAAGTVAAALFPYWFRRTGGPDELIIMQRGSTGPVYARDAQTALPIIGSPSGPNLQVRNGGSVWAALAGSAEVVQVVDSAQAGACAVWRNGSLYLTSRRSPNGAVSDLIAAGVIHGSDASGASQLDIGDWFFITW